MDVDSVTDPSPLKPPPVVKPLKPQLGHTFAGGLEAWSYRVTATVRERVSGHLLQQVPGLMVTRNR
jgi:hypothetical protein